MRACMLCNSRWPEQIRIFANQGCSTMNSLMISGEKYFSFSLRLLRPQKTENIKVNMLYKPEYILAFQNCKKIENRLTLSYRILNSAV